MILDKKKEIKKLINENTIKMHELSRVIKILEQSIQNLKINGTELKLKLKE